MSRKHKRTQLLDPFQVEGDVCIWPGCNDAITLGPAKLPFCPLHGGHVINSVVVGIYSNDRAMSEARQTHAAKKREQVERDLAISESKGDQPGFIYYLSIGERIKIGFATNVRKRMRAYPPGAKLLAVHPGTLDLEKVMHRQFAHALLEGREWFSCDSALTEHIEAVRAQFGDPKNHAFHYRRRSSAEAVSTSKWTGRK